MKKIILILMLAFTPFSVNAEFNDDNFVDKEVVMPIEIGASMVAVGLTIDLSALLLLSNPKRAIPVLAAAGLVGLGFIATGIGVATGDI
ncbi:hypothetical protein [uncultured Gammaproteobacteria bacterium]|jgi:hypothetical protein|nr:hypothetical protein [uncultured Gammaproteobacteria bacterium]